MFIIPDLDPETCPRNVRKLDNILILWCILAFMNLGSTGAPKPTGQLLHSYRTCRCQNIVEHLDASLPRTLWWLSNGKATMCPKSLFSSLSVNILQYFLFFWIFCFHKLFCRIYISLISFAHAYLYIMLTPTHIWHTATRHCRVTAASRKNEIFDCEGQVAQHWCACCYGDWGAELSLILMVLRLTLPYFALPHHYHHQRCTKLWNIEGNNFVWSWLLKMFSSVE